MLNLTDILQQSLDYISSNNCHGMVQLTTNNGVDIKVRQGLPLSQEYVQSSTCSIKIISSTGIGYASVTNLTWAAIKNGIDKAIYMSKFLELDPYESIVKPLKFANVDLNSNITPVNGGHDYKKIVDFCQHLESIGLNDKQITNSEGVEYVSEAACTYIGNTKGLLAQKQDNYARVYAEFIAGKNQTMQYGTHYEHGKSLALTEDLAIVAKLAVQDAVSKLNPQKAKSYTGKVLFNSESSSDIIKLLLQALNGNSQYKQNSFLLDSLNQTVAAEHISIQENPHIPTSIYSGLFDKDGLPTKPKHIIKQGVVTSYLLNHYAATRLNMQSTGNAGFFGDMFVTGNTIKGNGLKELGTGLLVTSLFGFGVDMTSGEFSKGCNGFWVENGEIQYPVQEITVAGNLKHMVKNIIAFAEDLDPRLSIKVGSTLIDKMTVVGN